jgi:hypothetical protein
MPTTPAAINHILKAADEADFDTLVGCFVEEGTVLDEGHTYHGREEIRRLAREPAVQVAVHQGNFSGGVAGLTYRFTLSGDRIADLSILQ